MTEGIEIQVFFSKNDKQKSLKSEPSPIVGTWKLINGTTISGTDTLLTDYTQGQEMIKIINETHFSFLRHDLTHGEDSTAIFVAGGGSYSLDGNKYTEHLNYCSARAWEGNSFEFEFGVRVILVGASVDFRTPNSIFFSLSKRLLRQGLRALPGNIVCFL